MSDRLEEILGGAFELGYGQMCTKEDGIAPAKQALQSYVDSKVIEGRVDGRRLELQNVNFVLPPSPELFKYTKKRIAELKALNHRKDKND